MIVISANYDCGFFSDPTNDFSRFWPIVHQVSDAPKLVVILFGKCIQSSEIGMNIGNDGYLHETSKMVVWTM